MKEEHFALLMEELKATRNQFFVVISLSIITASAVCSALVYATIQDNETKPVITIEAKEIPGDLRDQGSETF